MGQLYLSTLSAFTLKIAPTVANQNFEPVSPLDTQIHVLKTQISNFGLCGNLMVEVCLDVLNEHEQRCGFAICQQISLKFWI